MQLQNSNTARISNSPHGSAVSSHGSSQPAGSSAVSRHATYYPVQHHANVTVHVNVGSSSHYHHPHGYDHHGLPNGYWHYDPHNGWHYSHWAAHDPHYHHYADNWHYHYHHDHHYYWSYYPDYHYYPHHWHSYVYVVPPSEYDSTPRYRGPEIDVSRLDKLMESKWAIDQLRADLNDVPFAERETDSYRFFVKDVIDSYQYLLLKVYEFASRSDWRGVHHDPTYQRAVESIWGASLAVLQDYEAQFPYDTAMRADSLTVLYSNIAETKLVRDSDYARNNPFYVALLDKIGREISF